MSISVLGKNAFKLRETHEASLHSTDAYTQIWDASKKLSLEKDADNARLEYLNEAKRCLVAGISYTDLAAHEGNKAVSITLYSKATSMFCRAQRFAQLAYGASTYAGTP